MLLFLYDLYTCLINQLLSFEIYWLLCFFFQEEGKSSEVTTFLWYEEAA